MTKFVNCTPHPISVESSDDNVVTFQPSGIIPRCAQERVALGDIGGVRLIGSKMGVVEGLPEPQPSTVYIVSGMIVSALAGSRPDVVAPDTGADALRNEKGHIVTVRGFVQ